MHVERLKRWFRVRFHAIKRAFKPPTRSRFAGFPRQSGLVIIGKEDLKRIMHLRLGERERLMSKARVLGIAYLDVERVRIDPELRGLIPLSELLEHSALPIKRDGNKLWIAMPDEANFEAMSDIAAKAGCRGVPVLAMASAIDQVLTAWSADQPADNCIANTQ